MAKVFEFKSVGDLKQKVEGKDLALSVEVYNQIKKAFYSKVTKCKRWMPWLLEATKDVTSCDKLRLGANDRLKRRFPNGVTHYLEEIIFRKKSKPGELKHLSTRRKRKQFSDSVSSGERKRISPNLFE